MKREAGGSGVVYGPRAAYGACGEHFLAGSDIAKRLDFRGIDISPGHIELIEEIDDMETKGITSNHL